MLKYVALMKVEYPTFCSQIINYFKSPITDKNGAEKWLRDEEVSLKNQPFLLMESAPAVTNWKPINKLKRPGMDRLSGLQAVAHGSDSVQYFQFRKSRGSSEKFHGVFVRQIELRINDDARIYFRQINVGRTRRAIRPTGEGIFCSTVLVL